MGNTHCCDSDQTAIIITEAHLSDSNRWVVQWLDDKNILYNRYRYTKSHYQPKVLKKGEIQFTCYVRHCNHYIRIRQLETGRWVVTGWFDHDPNRNIAHIDRLHVRFTAQSAHLDNITELAKKESKTSGISTRAACESQILQNPKINQITSVQRLKRKIGTVRPETFEEFPPYPTCTASAAQSLKDYPIWKKNFYGHCKDILTKKISEFVDEKEENIKISINVKDFLKEAAMGQEEGIVKNQLQVASILEKLGEVQDVLKLLRMNVNGSDKHSDFLIDMRQDGSQMIFGSRCGYSILKSATLIGFDQLCRVVPSLNGIKCWQQAWIIHGVQESHSVDIQDESFPAFLCLMDDHTKESHDEIIQRLVDYAESNIDENFECLTSKEVRLMGDWSLAEHNSLGNSKYIQVKSDDYCAWHFINSVMDNMKDKKVIEYYYSDVMFRYFIRCFEILRAIHLDCALTALDLIRIKSWKQIKGSAKRAFRDFLDGHLIPNWRDRFGLDLLNCQGSFVMDNNLSEGYNLLTLMDIGVNEPWWPFLWNMKKYFAVIAARFETYKTNGFQRRRSVARRERCAALQNIWNKFEVLDRTNKDIVWKYVECLYFCWDNEYEKLNGLLNCL
eukprot:321733_1